MNTNSNFKALGLSASTLKAIEDKAYSLPTPIQQQAIPAVLKGKDVMAAAQTGTGKTAAFTLPILDILVKGARVQANQARTLILAPTRELAIQIGESILEYGKYLPLRSTVVYGGVKINPQMMTLRKGVDILIATPGRLLDLHQQNAVSFQQLEILVLDEADRMLDMGFITDLQKILAILPKQRQTLMFSATFSDQIRELARTLVSHPVEISVSPKNTTAKTVSQWMVPVDKKRKPALLKYLIKENNWKQVLVFCKTKQGVDKLITYLEEQGIKSAAIHGNKSQAARSKALEYFKQESVQVLVATDLAARGLDIDQLPQVVNFDLPTVAADYIHRIGRTGRAGLNGQAVSLVSADEFDNLTDVEHLINKLLPRKLMDGFEPRHDVPMSKLWRKPKKPKKPKKSKKEKQTEVGSVEYTQAKQTSGKTVNKNKQGQNKQEQNKQEQGQPKNKRGKFRSRYSKDASSSDSNDGARPPKRKFKQGKKLP